MCARVCLRSVHSMSALFVLRSTSGLACSSSSFATGSSNNGENKRRISVLLPRVCHQNQSDQSKTTSMQIKTRAHSQNSSKSHPPEPYSGLMVPARYFVDGERRRKCVLNEMVCARCGWDIPISEAELLLWADRRRRSAFCHARLLL